MKRLPMYWCTVERQQLHVGDVLGLQLQDCCKPASQQDTQKASEAWRKDLEQPTFLNSFDWHTKYLYTIMLEF
jgi:hypothetical protein